ncbi:MAG: thiolase family protein [Dehalococcoidia bacterium]|nr:thiolase family protein [Dehalococcoidia bacterium]
MSFRGQAAIVGFAELPSVRDLPGRSSNSLLAEVGAAAIRDAGLRKADIDGLITRGEDIGVLALSEYMQIKPDFCEGVTMHGASGAFSIQLAAAAIHAGFANYILCVFGGTRDEALGGVTPASRRRVIKPSIAGEWDAPFGPVVAANGNYGLIKQRHMYQYGSKDSQFARMAANQRFNGLTNPNAVFKGQPLTVEDVLSSRYVCDPIHLLEAVMPCIGGGAVVVTSAERARTLPNPPVYVLGAGGSAGDHEHIWQHAGDVTVTAVTRSAPRAYKLAGYGPKDMQFAEMYD